MDVNPLQFFAYYYGLVGNLEITYYFRIATWWIAGQRPYIDFFWEYPPGFLYILGIIRGFTGDLSLFAGIYFSLLLASYTFFMLSLYDFATKNIRGRIEYIVITVGLLIIFPLLPGLVRKTFINPDVIISIFVLHVLLTVYKTGKLKFLSAVVLGIATGIRIYPGILLILFLSKSRLKDSLVTVFGVILGLFLTILPFLWQSFTIIPGFLKSVLYQTSRPVGIESVAGSLMYWSAVVANLKLNTVVELWAINLQYTYGQPVWWSWLFAVRWLPLLITLGMIFATSVTGWLHKLLLAVGFRKNPQDPGSYQENPDLFKWTTILILGLILANTVLSPQYLIWLWPSFLLWSIVLYTYKLSLKQKALYILSAGLFLTAHILTTLFLEYYNNVEFLINLHPVPPLIIVGFRNLSLLALFICLWLFPNPTSKRRN